MDSIHIKYKIRMLSVKMNNVRTKLFIYFIMFENFNNDLLSKN